MFEHDEEDIPLPGEHHVLKDREYLNSTTNRRIWVDKHHASPRNFKSTTDVDGLIIHIYSGDEAIKDEINKAFPAAELSESSTSLGKEYRIHIPFPIEHKHTRDTAKASVERNESAQKYNRVQATMFRKVDKIITSPKYGFHCTHKEGHDLPSH